MKPITLFFMFASLMIIPLGAYLCFHYGWGNDPKNWFWIVGCWAATLFFSAVTSLSPQGVTRIRRALQAAIYFFVVFTLSATAIIYGWGMHPRNWWWIVGPYAIAAFFPPFNAISQNLFFWRRQSSEQDDWKDECVGRLTQALHTAIGQLGPEHPATIDLEREMILVGNIIRDNHE